MTSEEIYSNIKQLTGIPKNHRMISMAQEKDYDPESDNNLINCPIFMAFNVGEKDCIPITLDKGAFENCVQNETFNKIVFNPYALPLGLLIWMQTQPKNQNTKNMLFSAFNWLDCPTTIDGLSKAISEDPIPYVRKYLDKHGSIRNHNGGYRPSIRRPQAVRGGRDFDVDISDCESGRAAYWCNRRFSRVFFSDDVIDEVCDAESDEDALQIIEDYLIDNYTSGDADEYNDYEYEDHEFYDNEDYNNYTDMDELLREIRESR